MGRPDSANFAEEYRKKNQFSNDIAAQFNRAGGTLEKISFWSTLFSDNTDYKEARALQDFPKKSELPQFIQNFLEEIKDMNDLDKIKAIHNFTLQNVDYIDQSCGDKLDPKTILNEEKIYGDCDDFAFYNCALMKYAGIKNVGLVGASIKDTLSNGSIDQGGGHAVAVTKIDNQIYILDQNYVAPIPIKDGKSLNPTLLSDEGSKNEGQITGNIEVERIKVFIEFGNNQNIFIWNHPDDDKVFVSNCPEDQKPSASTQPPSSPNTTQKP